MNLSWSGERRIGNFVARGRFMFETMFLFSHPHVLSVPLKWILNHNVALDDETLKVHWFVSTGYYGWQIDAQIGASGLTVFVLVLCTLMNHSCIFSGGFLRPNWLRPAVRLCLYNQHNPPIRPPGSPSRLIEMFVKFCSTFKLLRRGVKTKICVHVLRCSWSWENKTQLLPELFMIVFLLRDFFFH